ncbi:MAG: phosphoglycerate dehydrogenase [Lachnospiraceae bacterium]|nr:phosphoglycerate dehydrogenase [Lachnospiraceae bacterium]
MMTHKILCLNEISTHGTERFTENYTLTKELSEANGILVRSADMHKTEFPDELMAIARAGAGVNNIPLDRCTQEGIVVFNTPGANANGVKELVIAGMLMAARDIHGGIDWVSANRKDPEVAATAEKKKKLFAGSEIKGKTLGVIGLGAIGVLVANAAESLGMTVYGYDPFLSVNGAWQLSRKIKHSETLDEIYEKCDYITLHVPLLDSTKAMINKESIAKMKDGVVVLNYARDLLVDEMAMTEALMSGKVKRYMCDFPNTRTVIMPNTTVTPHLGASTEESEDNCAVMAVDQMMAYLENGTIHNSVNFPNCDLAAFRGSCRLLIFNENKPNMIGQFTSALAAEGINILDMSNKSRGNVAYTAIDPEQDITDEMIEKLAAIDGVLRVRVIRNA